MNGIKNKSSKVREVDPNRETLEITKESKEFVDEVESQTELRCETLEMTKESKEFDTTQIIKSLRKDPELLNTINIEEILKKSNIESIDYLENKTLKSISTEIFETIQKLNLSEERTKDLCDKLIDYRLVNEIYELHKGKLVKTINLNLNNTYSSSPLTISPRICRKGGVEDVAVADKGEERVNKRDTKVHNIHMRGKVVNIKFLDNGTHVVCLNVPNRYSQYKFDQFLTFQKLSTEEQLILSLYEKALY